MAKAIKNYEKCKKYIDIKFKNVNKHKIYKNRKFLEENNEVGKYISEKILIHKREEFVYYILVSTEHLFNPVKICKILIFI